MNQNQRQYLQSAVQVLKEHGMEVNVKNISHFVNGVIPENIIQEWMNGQEMQALDQALDPDGLDEQGQRLWNEYEREEAIECECGKPLVFGHECHFGYWDGRQHLRSWDNLIDKEGVEF